MYELERYASSGEIGEWILRVFSLRIDDTDDFFGDNIWNCMMVCHDDIDTKGLGIANRSYISCSTVDSDDEPYIFAREIIEKILLESVSIMNPMRESIGYLATDFS